MDLRKTILLLNIFLAGFVVIALEILGIRIFASFFGYSIFVWGTIIGLILVSLSIGYFFGGIIADKYGQFSTIYKVILAATFYLAVTIAIYPFLLKALSKLNLYSGIFLSAIILLTPPSILLSMVSPIATKTLLKRMKEGRTIGNVYALSNFGSIVGVFATTFYFIPFWGSKLTLIFCFSALLLNAIVGLRLEKLPMNSLLILFIFAILLFSLIFAFAENKSKYLLKKTESAYNVIEVKQFNNRISLLLNNHPMSYKEKEETLELYFYDAMAVFPELMNLKKILILGFAAGTVAGKIETFFPTVKIVGVEIDDKVVKMASQFFGLKELKNTIVYVDDARHFLKTNDNKYSIIFNNAINAKFIPFHLVSKEYFELSKSKLNDNGILVNYSFYSESKTLLRDSIAKTMCECFPSVYYLDFPNQKVSLLFGFKKSISKKWILQMIHSAINRNKDKGAKILFNYYKNIQEFTCQTGKVITDDKNPIDQITLKQIL